MRKHCILLTVILLAAPTPSWAGKLGDFEKGLGSGGSGGGGGGGHSGGSSGGYNGGNHDWDGDSDDCGDDPSDMAACLVLYMFVAASGATVKYAGERQAGEPTIPLLRVDNAYQNLIDADVNAYSVRGQAGWAFLGVGGEFMRYWEDNPKDHLDTWALEGLWRLSGNRHFRLDLAVGGRGFHRTQGSSGVQGGFSVGIYPKRWYGLEADLRWADIKNVPLADYRGGLTFRYPPIPYAQFQMGYRLVSIPGEKLHGPEFSLGVMY